jgi:hypothetical protein
MSLLVSDITLKWGMLKMYIESAEKDLNKNLEKGTRLAGRRVRSSLREARKVARELQSLLVRLEKSRSEVE